MSGCPGSSDTPGPLLSRLHHVSPAAPSALGRSRHCGCCAGSSWALVTSFTCRGDRPGLKRAGATSPGQRGRRVSAGVGGPSLGLGRDDDVAIALHPRQLVALEVHHELAQPCLARHQVQPDLGLRLRLHRLLAGGTGGQGVLGVPPSDPSPSPCPRCCGMVQDPPSPSPHAPREPAQPRLLLCLWWSGAP